MAMHNPPHPGEALREDVLPELKLSTTDLAKQISYSRRRLSTLLNGRSAVKADLAWRLELAGVGKAHMWLARQSAYDLWCAQHKSVPPITKLGAQQSKAIPSVNPIDQLQRKSSKAR
ncbi:MULTISPECIES: HigA family addiction module antitoxin [Pseudomonas]|uniref:HigA family addiction module antidote protein n=1 Tax=Pseudomonas quercus TaxID=2722792 RepID=A0ABX0YAA7_9PSED|nr:MULTISPECIES: HigA family addiction module antitoxin [Pseudomonas]MBF7141731.1 HigA family addiction module antidote protein [Pseudomonas sp. LY10J]NJP00270.1 HigA family addiction module antidote protein [Pseudomonas quercus]